MIMRSNGLRESDFTKIELLFPIYLGFNGHREMYWEVKTTEVTMPASHIFCVQNMVGRALYTQYVSKRRNIFFTFWILLHT